MEIFIKKINIEQNGSDLEIKDASGLYIVRENNTEFKIVCRFDKLKSIISLYGEKGTLHIKEETNQVVRQIVSIGDACGLNITEVPVEGLSPLAIKGIIFVERDKNIKELIIKT
ncbi:MAG: hypothetical protein N2596_06700 [Syntrophorhabdaceae bacterium]|nr:hypothetical protein [Syntrophorhabdaceae bacterium]